MNIRRDLPDPVVIYFVVGIQNIFLQLVKSISIVPTYEGRLFTWYRVRTLFD